jgi:hypothetical protein
MSASLAAGCHLILSVSSPAAFRRFPWSSQLDFREDWFREDWHRKFSAKPLILLVGAPRFELGTPSPPDFMACQDSALFHNGLWPFCFVIRDFFRDFLNALKCGGYFVRQNVRVLDRGLDISVTKRVLD